MQQLQAAAVGDEQLQIECMLSGRVVLEGETHQQIERLSIRCERDTILAVR